MNITHRHDWNLTPPQAIALQQQMVKEVIYDRPLDLDNIRLVAGVDVSVKDNVSQAAVVVLAWEARIVGGNPTTSDETLEIRTFAADEIPWELLAFQTTTWAIRDWIRLRHPEIGYPSDVDDHERWPGESA